MASQSAEEATKEIDMIHEKYDHVPPYTPTPTFTPTYTFSPSLTMTPSPTVTPSYTPTYTSTHTVSPTVTWTVYKEFIESVEDFVHPLNGSQVDFAVCPCVIDNVNTDSYVFGAKRYDENKANKTIVIQNERYEIVTSYTSFTKDVLDEDGVTTSQVPFFKNSSLLVPKNTQIDMYILFNSNVFYELEYTGNEQVYNISSSIVPSNHDPFVKSTYVSFSIKTQIQIDGYRLLKQKESRIIQSVEDVTPQIGFAIKTNDYAYTYVVYIGVTHGTDNIEIDMITKNNVIIAMNGETVVGVSSIRTTSNPSRIAVQIHTNTMEDEYITFKILRHVNVSMYTLGSVLLNITGGTHVFRVGYARKEMKAPYDYISINSGSTRSMVGTYLSSIMNHVSAIRSQQGYLIKTGNGFVGTLGKKSISYTLSTGTFYILTLNEDVVWEYVGTPLLNTNITYDIQRGENWIAHPDIEDTSFEAFTQTFTSLQSVKTQNTMMTYTDNKWIGDISTIQPNEGYIISSSSSYDVLSTYRHYSTVPVQIETNFNVMLDDIPCGIEIIDANNLRVTIQSVQFECVSKQDQSYYDSNLLTIVPTLFESTNDVEVQIGGYTGVKVKGVLSFNLAYSNGMYDTSVSGFLDVYVHMGDTDSFTGDEPEMSWMSDIRGDNGYVIKKI